MSDGMIDRVAKAICNWQDDGNWDRVCSVHPTDSTQIHADHFRVMARAALKALSQPTDKMLEAAYREQDGHLDYHESRIGEYMLECLYKAFIDAALDEKEK